MVPVPAVGLGGSVPSNVAGAAPTTDIEAASTPATTGRQTRLMAARSLARRRTAHRPACSKLSAQSRGHDRHRSAVAVERRVDDELVVGRQLPGAERKSIVALQYRLDA